MTAGAIHRLGRMVSLFEGIGYGRTATAWELAESEGGGLALNDGLTHKGLAAELGVVLSFGRISVSASAVTIAGRQWQGCIGVGINIGKDEDKDIITHHNDSAAADAGRMQQR